MPQKTALFLTLPCHWEVIFCPLTKQHPCDKLVLDSAEYGMMSLFLDYLWTWIILTFAVGVCGCALYFNDPKGRNFAIALVSPILTLVLGVSLYYGIDTDRKSIRRILDTLVATVEADKPETVCQFLKAEEIQQLAKKQMRLISISRAKYHHLEIKFNDATSPPIAQVRFTAIFYWKNKVPIDGFSLEKPLPESVRFETEWVKTKNQSWLISKLQYFPSRGYL